MIAVENPVVVEVVSLNEAQKFDASMHRDPVVPVFEEMGVNDSQKEPERGRPDGEFIPQCSPVDKKEGQVGEEDCQEDLL